MATKTQGRHAKQRPWLHSGEQQQDSGAGGRAGSVGSRRAGRTEAKVAVFSNAIKTHLKFPAWQHSNMNKTVFIGSILETNM